MPPRASNNAPQAALCCLRNLSRRAPITSVVVQDTAATAEISKVAYNLEVLVVNTWSEKGPAAAVAMLPAELVSAFMTAATHLNSYLKQQQPQLAQLRQQQPQLQHQLCALADALLQMWNSIARPLTAAWVSQLLPAVAATAELALHVFTGPAGCALACGSSSSDQPSSTAVPHAAIAINLVQGCIGNWRDGVLTAARQAGSTLPGPTRAEAAVLAHSVQKASILHCSAFVQACREQEQQAAPEAPAPAGSSSSSGWAPAAATQLLQQMGFPMDAVQRYTAAVCRAFPSEPQERAQLALQRLNEVLDIRKSALLQPDWAVLYRGILPDPPAAAAAVAAALAAAPPGGRGASSTNLPQHVVAQGFLPEQLANLALEVLGVGGPLGPGHITPAVAGLGMISGMLRMAVSLRPLQLPPLERSERERYAEGCVTYVWHGLGQQLLRASGVAEAELVEGVGGSDTSGGHQAPARVYSEVGQDGVWEDLPAGGLEQMHVMWKHFSSCLLYALGLYEDCFSKAPYELYLRHPMRSSRILEASLRAQGLPATSSPTYTMQLLLQATHTALQATSPEGAFSSVELLQNRRLAVRACSQHISALKAACQPLPLQVDAAKVLLHQIQVVSVVANLGPIVYSWAIGWPSMDAQRQAALRTMQPGGFMMELPVFGRRVTSSNTLGAQEAYECVMFPAWLALTGRALVALGRLFVGAPAWLQNHLQQATAGRCEPAVLSVLTAHAAAFDWLCAQLRQLKEHPDAAAAAALPPEVLQELAQLAEDLSLRFEPLLQQCAAMRASFGPNRAGEVAVLQGLLRGASEGWLHEGLQQLGSSVWAAWPQKYACNDDACMEMAGLAESSCSRQCCSRCRVAYYCCKQHQTRHWRQHKKVCAHLKQLPAGSAQAAAAAAADT